MNLKFKLDVFRDMLDLVSSNEHTLNLRSASRNRPAPTNLEMVTEAMKLTNVVTGFLTTPVVLGTKKTSDTKEPQAPHPQGTCANLDNQVGRNNQPKVEIVELEIEQMLKFLNNLK